MSVSVSMPQLGESVTEGTVTRWLKKEGERVEADEPLLEVSTDKVDTEIPSPAAGVLRGITVGEDETVEVGAQLAVIEESADAAAGGSGAPGGPAEPAPAPASTQPAPAGPEPGGNGGGTSGSPASGNGLAAGQDGSYGDGSASPATAPAWSPPAPSQPAPSQQAPSAPQPSYQSQQAQFAPASQATAPTPLPTGDGPYVTPLVRKLAAEHGVDLESVSGTGVGGRIRKQDVLDAARARREAEAARPAQAPPAPSAPPAPAAPAAAPAAPAGDGAARPTAPSRPAVVASGLRGTTQRMSRPRQLIAQRMVESLQTSAQLTTVVEVDVTAIARLRDRTKADFEAREGVKLSFLPFFALAAVEALKAYPMVNAVIDTANAQVTYHDAEHLGVAVDTERGLMVPVIHNAGDLNLGGLARKIADLAARTRSGQVSPDELSGGTFTLTNTGSRGALFDTPIINQPQVGILGTGSVVKRPVVVDDPALGEVIAVRSMVYLALTYDHRLVDGADAARFLTMVRDRLEEGSFEAELGL